MRVVSVRSCIWGNNLCLMLIFFPRLLRFDVNHGPPPFAISSTPDDLSYFRCFPGKNGDLSLSLLFVSPSAFSVSLISACVSIPLLITDNTCALFHQPERKHRLMNFHRSCSNGMKHADVRLWGGFRYVWIDIQFSMWNFTKRFTFLKEEEDYWIL